MASAENRGSDTGEFRVENELLARLLTVASEQAKSDATAASLVEQADSEQGQARLLIDQCPPAVVDWPHSSLVEFAGHSVSAMLGREDAELLMKKAQARVVRISSMVLQVTQNASVFARSLTPDPVIRRSVRRLTGNDTHEFVTGGVVPVATGELDFPAVQDGQMLLRAKEQRGRRFIDDVRYIVPLLHPNTLDPQVELTIVDRW
jgi:hypothetical protein